MPLAYIRHEEGKIIRYEGVSDVNPTATQVANNMLFVFQEYYTRSKAQRKYGVYDTLSDRMWMLHGDKKENTIAPDNWIEIKTRFSEESRGSKYYCGQVRKGVQPQTVEGGLGMSISK